MDEIFWGAGQRWGVRWGGGGLYLWRVYWSWHTGTLCKLSKNLCLRALLSTVNFLKGYGEHLPKTNTEIWALPHGDLSSLRGSSYWQYCLRKCMWEGLDRGYIGSWKIRKTLSLYFEDWWYFQVEWWLFSTGWWSQAGICSSCQWKWTRMGCLWKRKVLILLLLCDNLTFLWEFSNDNVFF